LDQEELKVTEVIKAPAPYPLYDLMTELRLGPSWKPHPLQSALQIEQANIERLAVISFAAGGSSSVIEELRRRRMIEQSDFAAAIGRTVLISVGREFRKEFGFVSDFDGISTSFASVHMRARGKATFWPTMMVVGSGIMALTIALGEYKDGREGAIQLTHDLRRVANYAVREAAVALDIIPDKVECELTSEAKAAIEKSLPQSQTRQRGSQKTSVRRSR
jgi:hypothetical protein